MSAPVVVTGVGGFIGAAVARGLLAEGQPVIGVDDFSQGRRDNVPAGVELIEADLADAATFARLPGGVDAVLHLAGQSSGEISFDDPIADLRKNTISTLGLIRWAIAQRARRFVYASSMSVYGPHLDVPAAETDPCQPLSCYGVGKLASEQYLRVYAPQLPSAALRMFNVYGPGQDMTNMRQGMVSIYLTMALRDGRVQVKGALDRYRDFVFIDDAVDAWIRAWGDTRPGFDAINVGTGHRTTVLQLLTAMAEVLPGITWHQQGATAGDQFGIYADTRKRRALWGEAPVTDVPTGLRRFVAWAKTVVAPAIEPAAR